MAPCSVLVVIALTALVPATSSVYAKEAVPCDLRSFKYGYACVCNSTYCDTLPRPERPANGSAIAYVTSKDGVRFQKEVIAIEEGLAEKPGLFSSRQRLLVDRSITYQKVKGFGGAFTDAVGENLRTLPEEAQDLLLRSYFSEDGLEYTIGRVPIGGTDFSSRKYTYLDTEGANLTSFALQPEDLDYKIPYIQRAIELLPADAGELLLIGAAWCPPIWTKTNKAYSGFGFLEKQYYQFWADYHMKFLDAYKDNHNLTFFAISTGNEPLNGVIPINRFNSLGWVPKTHRRWIRDNLGPTLRNSTHKDVAILALDDQRIVLPWWIDEVLDDEAVSDYVDGIAVHWYLNFITPDSLLDTVHEKFPNKFLISTEACNGDKPWQLKKVELGSWIRGQLYFEDIIGVMNHWMTGWVDWNLALNLDGGPTWKPNYVDSAILVNSEEGEFYKQPTYYALGHFSKFIPRGSTRVDVTSDGGSLLGGKVQHIAFLRPDGGITVVLLNKHSRSRSVDITEEGYGHISLTLRPNSFTTVLYW